MHSLRSALFILLAAAAGFFVGLRADRVARHFAPARSQRPPALEAAWRAADDADRPALDRALVAIGEGPLQTPAFEAERALLQAIATDDPAAVRAVADTHPDLPAGATALVWLIARASTPDERADLIATLRLRFPASWRLETARFRAAAGP